MGRAIKNLPLAEAPTKLVATGEYIMSQVGPINAEQSAYTIWTYNYPKQKAANETYLYMAAQFNALEAYSYAPAPCIRCSNQTADQYNGSQFHFGYQEGSNAQREFNLYSCQNYAHSQALDGRSANISGSNFGVGSVPIIIRWESASGADRPGHTFCPTPRAGAGSGGSQQSSMDNRGEENWYGYLRVWEIAY